MIAANLLFTDIPLSSFQAIYLKVQKKIFQINSMLHFATKFTVKSFLDPLMETLILLKLQRFEI